MPTIPILSAQQGPGVLNLPPIQRQPGWEQVTQLGADLANIDAKIQAARNDALLVTASSTFDAGLKDLRQQAQDNPDYENRVPQFLKDVGDLSTSINQTLEGNRAVSAAFLSHQQRVVPGHIIDVKHDARKAQVLDIRATVANHGETLSTVAAEGTPQEATTAIATYAEEINRHQANGIFNPLEAENAKRKFRSDTLEKNMSFLATSNPDELYRRNLDGQYRDVEPVKRLTYLEKAAIVQDKARARAHALTADAKEIVLRDAYSQAATGDLTESFLTEAEKNHNPLVSPQDAYHLRERNEKAPSSEGNRQVGSIMDELFSGNTTVERIKNARSELVALSKQLGHHNDTLSKALDHLSSLIRSENSVEAQQITAKITAAKDEARATAPTILPGPLGAMQKNKQARDDAERAAAIRRGVPPQEILKQQKDREAERRKNRSKSSIAVEDALKQLGR